MEDNILADSTYSDIDTKLVNALLQFNQLYRFNKTHVHNMGSHWEFPQDEKHHKMKYSEFLLLYYIRASVRDKKSGVSATELSARMNVKPPTINPLLTNLENTGYIKRKTDSIDRRIVRIELTPEGMKLTQDHQDMFFRKVHGLAAYLGNEKSTTLIELMNDVYTYLEHRCD
jgi:DNA-binding MarR family transcriptional regulator